MKHLIKTLACQAVILIFLPLQANCSPIDVFVSIPPIKWLCDQVGGKLVEPHVLVNKGQDPHSFEPTPRQTVFLSSSKLFFSVGMSFEKRIAIKLKDISKQLQWIDISQGIRRIPMDANGHSHNLTNDHDSLDPHIWLSPLNLKLMATNIAKAMIELDPTNRIYYQQNLQRVSHKLDQLHSSIKKELAPYRGTAIYVFHPAFGYFTNTYHLKQKSVELDGKKPTPKQLAFLIRKARSSGVKTLFVQPQFDPKSAAAIATAIDGKVVSLDPLGEDPEFNLQLMSATIKEAIQLQQQTETSP